MALAQFAFIFLAGCATAPAPFSTPAGEVVALNVMTMPVALNMDNRAGVDGFSVKVYANDATHAKTVPISHGQLEIVSWDGTLFGRTNLPPALKIWTFTAKELRQNEFRAGIGTGYEFALRWGTNQPTKGLITVAARYTAPDGRIVTSTPSSVSVVSK